MHKSILACLAVSMLLAGSSPVLLAAAAESPFATPLQWKSTGVLIEPISDETHKIVSVKDPTVVRYNGL